MKLLRSGEVDEAIKCLAGQNPYGEPKNSWDLWMFIPQSIQTWFWLISKSWHDNLREDSLDGRSVGRVDEVGVSSILCGYDGFNDRYADKIFDQQYFKKIAAYPQHKR